MCEFLDKLIKVNDYDNARFLFEIITNQKVSNEILQLCNISTSNYSKYSHFRSNRRIYRKHRGTYRSIDIISVYEISINGTTVEFVKEYWNNRYSLGLMNFNFLNGTKLYFTSIYAIQKLGTLKLK